MDLLDLDGIDRVFVQSRKVPIRHPACLPEPVLRTAPHAGFRASRTLTGNRRLGTAKPVWPGHYSSAHETCPVPHCCTSMSMVLLTLSLGTVSELVWTSSPACRRFTPIRNATLLGFSRQRDFPLVHSQTAPYAASRPSGTAGAWP